MKKQRQANLELLRILCMLSLIITHTMSHGGLVDLVQEGMPNYPMVWVLFCLGFPAINLYLLISSYFQSTSRFSSFRLAKLEGQLLFYSLGITLLFWFFFGAQHEVKILVFSLFPAASDFYWFVSMYMGLSLMSPVLNRLVDALTKRQLLCTCVLGVTLVGVWPNVFYFSSALNTAGGVSIAWFVVVYLVGAYIRRYYTPDGKAAGLLFSGFGTLMLLPVSRFLIQAMMKTPLGRISMLDDLLWGYSVFYYYSSILVTAASILLFLGFLNLRIEGPRLTKAINVIASAGLGVYLLHDHYYIREWYWQWLFPYRFVEKWYFVPAILGCAVLTYAVCMVIELIRQKIFGLWEKRPGFQAPFKRLDAWLRRCWQAEE